MNDNDKIVTKEYKINESVLVTYYILDSLYQSFFAKYPKDIGDEVVELINHLRDELESDQEKDFPNCDIEDSDFFERVKFIVSLNNDGN